MATFSTEKVIEHFERSTGHRLEVVNRFESHPLVSGWDSLEPKRPLNELGCFDVGVFYDIEQAKADGLLDGLIPTEQGVYWIEHVPERRGEERSWSAMKLYSNVQVIWRPKEMKLDERWKRLNEVFSSISPRS